MTDSNDNADRVNTEASSCRCPVPIDRFTLGQKIFIRICLYGFGATGIIGAFAENWVAGTLVLVVSIVAGLVVLRCFCSHCPYPRDHDTCYAMPPPIIKAMTQHRPGPLHWGERAAFFAVLAAAMLLPQVWLIRRMPLFIAYWSFCLPTCFVFPFYICRRCRFTNCPFNRRKG